MDKIKVVSIALILLALAFATGRYTAQEPEITKNVETEVNTEKEKHKETTTVTEKRPDGSETTTTRTVEDTSTRTKRETETVVKIEPKTSLLTVSGLAAYKDGSISYGASVTKQFAGPINAGIFGLNNGTIGISIGVSF